MPKVYIKDAGSWKQVLRMWIKQSGVWKPITNANHTVNGVGRQVYPDTISTITYTTGGTYSYTVPAGVTSLVIKTVGAGGGGGGSSSGQQGSPYGGGGGGGGSGGTSNNAISVTPGETLTISVGAGGARGRDAGEVGSRTGTSGGNGGSSSVLRSSTSLISATGGGGGGGGTGESGYAGGSGGSAGTGTTSNGLAGSPGTSPDGNGWATGGAGANSSIGTGGRGGVVNNSTSYPGDAGGQGSGGGGGGSSGYNPNDAETIPGAGGDGFISITAIGANYQNYTANGSFSFVVPAGVTSLTTTIYGAGGGSGACNNNGDAWVGGGGGAGGKNSSTISVTPGETLTMVVGKKGYGASARFNSSYYYNPNNSTLGSGTSGTATSIKRGATELLVANGGTGGVQYGYGTGGTPTVANTSPPGHTGNGDGEQGSTPSYKGYGYNGPILGGTNGSGTPPASYGNAGTGYGNGGGQVKWNEPGCDGQDGAILLSWN